MKYEAIQKAGEWIQRMMLIGPLGHGRLHLLAILILLFLIGTALLGKAVLGVRARSKEQFTGGCGTH